MNVITLFLILYGFYLSVISNRESFNELWSLFILSIDNHLFWLILFYLICENFNPYSIQCISWCRYYYFYMIVRWKVVWMIKMQPFLRIWEMYIRRKKWCICSWTYIIIEYLSCQFSFSRRKKKYDVFAHGFWRLLINFILYFSTCLFHVLVSWIWMCGMLY